MVPANLSSSAPDGVDTGATRTGTGRGAAEHLAPDVNALPFVNRRYLAQDPHFEAGRWEANMVGARGCPYNCSFCGAAVSANPDITIRTRRSGNILEEMHTLRGEGVAAFRFVDDLFLGAKRVIDDMMGAFTAEHVGEWARWDATGRINVLHRAADATLDTLARNGLREVALGIESGSERMLTLIDKRINPDMTRTVVRRLAERGINVKGYFILGLPTETREEINTTVARWCGSCGKSPIRYRGGSARRCSSTGPTPEHPTGIASWQPAATPPTNC